MASELENAHLAYRQAVEKAEHKMVFYKIALAQAVGRAITVTGYPKRTIYRDQDDPETGEERYSRTPHYAVDPSPEESQPRTYVNRTLLSASDGGIDVALWPAEKSGPDFDNTQSVAHHVFLPHERILQIAFADDELYQ